VIIEGFEELNINPEQLNGLIFEEGTRYYIENLQVRSYSLENTTPYKINILENVIIDSSWSGLLCRVTTLLLSLFPEKKEDVYSFKCGWTRSLIFSRSIKTHFKPLGKDLYLNCNHTAVHSCWLLQDLLDFFDIDKSKVLFLIHRPCGAEKEELKQYFKSIFVRGFVYFLVNDKGKDLDRARKIVNVINKHLNPILRGISKSYTDLFLLNNNLTVLGYSKKVKEKLLTIPKYSNDNKKILCRYLDYLVIYYNL